MTPQSRADWLAERATYIGASEAAMVVLDDPKYGSKHELWRTKTQGWQKEESRAMRRGRFIEPFLLEEFNLETKLNATPGQFHRHKKWPHMACNTDAEGVINVGGTDYRFVLELKDVGYFAGQQFGNDGGDLVAEHYLIQVMYQMIVTGYPLGCLCALIDGRELGKYWYTFDPELSAVATVLDKDTARSIVFKVDQFWKTHIVGNVEPPMSGFDTDTDWLKGRRTAYETGQVINADEETDKECIKLKRAVKRHERASLVLAQRKNRVKRFMAENEASVLESSVGNFTWRTNAKGVAVFNTPFKSGKS